MKEETRINIKRLIKEKNIFELKLKSQEIKNNLEKFLLYQKATKIGIYYSKDREVDTREIILNLLQKNKLIFLPKIKKQTLEFKQIKSLSDLESGQFNILEPKKECPSITPPNLDLLIMPCTAIDKNGNRIGKGKGFYDRFLEKNKNLIKICLAFEFQVIPNIKPEQHDQRIDFIATEKRIFKTTNQRTKILDGKKLSEKILLNLKKKITIANIQASLAVILVGNNPASEIYVKKKKEKCKEIGINFNLIRFLESTTNNEIINKIKQLNDDENITGILIQLPLPKHLKTQEIINIISPQKDVDGLTNFNIEKLSTGQETFACCTPKGIITLLEKSKISLENKKIVLIGKGKLVGHPLSLMLKNRNINFSICDKKTKCLQKQTSKADVIITATGAAHLIKTDYIKKNAIIIDAGTAKLNGKIVGDVDFENVINKASKITPTPGGIGPMTIAMLLQNTIKAYYLQNNKAKKSFL